MEKIAAKVPLNMTTDIKFALPKCISAVYFTPKQSLVHSSIIEAWAATIQHFELNQSSFELMCQNIIPIKISAQVTTQTELDLSKFQQYFLGILAQKLSKNGIASKFERGEFMIESVSHNLVNLMERALENQFI